MAAMTSTTPNRMGSRRRIRMKYDRRKTGRRIQRRDVGIQPANLLLVGHDDSRIDALRPATRARHFREQVGASLLRIRLQRLAGAPHC